MKPLSYLLLFWPLCVFCSEDPVFDVRAGLHAGAGWVSYEERVSIAPIRSEWDAAAGRIGADLLATQWPIQLYGEFLYTFTAEDVEQWRESGVLVQENELTYEGTDLRVGIQYPIQELETFTLIPRAGLVVQWENYERDNFFLLREGGALFNIDQEINETVLAAGPSAGVSLRADVNDQLSVLFDTEVVWLGIAEAENDGFDVTIDDGEGWKWSGQLAIILALAESGSSVSLSLHADVREIDGARLDQPDGGIVEWPDNTLERYMLEVTWITTF